MSRHARRVDRTHAAIRATFQAYGWAVLDVSSLADAGCDLVVWKAHREGCVKLWLIEAKDGAKAPSKRKLTDNEIRMALSHTAVYRVIGSVDEAAALARG